MYTNCLYSLWFSVCVCKCVWLCVIVCVQTIHRGVAFALFALLLHLDSFVCCIIFPIFLLGHDFLRLPWRFVKNVYSLVLLWLAVVIISKHHFSVCYMHLRAYYHFSFRCSLSISLLLTVLFSSVSTLTFSTDTAKQWKKYNSLVKLLSFSHLSL